MDVYGRRDLHEVEKRWTHDYSSNTSRSRGGDGDGGSGDGGGDGGGDGNPEKSGSGGKGGDGSGGNSSKNWHGSNHSCHRWKCSEFDKDNVARSPSISPAEIAGISIGAVAIVIGILVLFIFWRRRLSRRAAAERYFNLPDETASQLEARIGGTPPAYPWPNITQ